MRHRKMVAPINSIKHVINLENSALASGSVRAVQCVQAVAQTAVTNIADVVEGSIVKAVYLELWYKSNAADGLFNKFQLVVEKVIGNQAPITFTQMNSIMTYPNKKNILHITQGVVGDKTTQSVPIIKGWVMIPKGKQRFGLDDEFFMTVSTTGDVAQTCGVVIFKEYK